MQTFTEEPLKADKSVMGAFAVLLDLHMRQVCRQDQLGFNDRKRQAQDHDPADCREKLPLTASACKISGRPIIVMLFSFSYCQYVVCKVCDIDSKRKGEHKPLQWR